MPDKKAIELSLNFIVIIIISIVVFSFGVLFINKLSSQAINIQDITVNELDKKIGELICEGSDRVCVGIEKKTLMKNEFGLFGLKIMNILDSQNFTIAVTRPNPSGYQLNKEHINTDLLTWVPKSRSFFIEKNEEKTLGIGVQVPLNTGSGTYIFDVNIYAADGSQYSSVHKLYVEVP